MGTAVGYCLFFLAVLRKCLEMTLFRNFFSFEKIGFKNFPFLTEQNKIMFMLCKQVLRVKALFICLVSEGDEKRASRVSSLSPLPSCLSVTRQFPRWSVATSAAVSLRCCGRCRSVMDMRLASSRLRTVSARLVCACARPAG